MLKSVELEEKLKEFFGYNSFRDYQKEIIQGVLSQKDVVAILPTGAGKSLCYQLPALLMEGTAIVVSPLISLMQDQVVSLYKNGISAAFINSSLHPQELRQVMEYLHTYKLIYVAPERLTEVNFLNRLKEVPLSFFVIDEAHCISQWGHSFRQEYRNLAILKKTFPDKAVIALTATATREVEKDLISQLNMRNPLIIKGSFDRPNLTLSIHPKVRSEKQLMLFLEERPGQSGIIYSSTRKGVESTYASLQAAGFKVGRYHAGLSDQERSASQHAFIYDQVNVMVATVAFGMGVHKPDVRFIVHLDMPRTIEQYYQEIGRAGRDGLPADCLMLYGIQDLILYKSFAEDLQDPVIQKEMKRKTDQLYRLCTSLDCRRKEILSYFGESSFQQLCGACDNCMEEDNQIDGTIMSQKILSCVFRLKQQVGLRMVIDVLRGSNSQALTQRNFHTLSTFGILADLSLEELRYYIESLVHLDFLERTEGEYPILKWTERSGSVIKEQTKVFFKKKIFIDKKTKPSQKAREQQIFYYHEPLYQALKELRTKLATAEKVPPFVVFSDRSIQEMATVFPLSEQDFIKVNGLGPIKWIKYGPQCLATVSQFASEKPAIRSAAASLRTEATHLKRSQSRELTVSLFQLGESIEIIMKKRELARSTVYSHLIEAIQQGVDINIAELVTLEAQQSIRRVIAKVGVEKLAPIKELVPEGITYDEIRLVAAFHQRKPA
ncbi:MAG: DNA helicase RecQ [Candidatus Protochlamydia sp.]|nr:DNA helicase RecQ [Candidatus Protochlamydia sp.]